MSQDDLELSSVLGGRPEPPSTVLQYWEWTGDSLQDRQALYPPSHTLSLSLWVFAVLQGVADRVRDRDRASVHGSPVARACVAGEPILDHLLGHHVASSSLLALFTLGPDFIVVK